MPVQDGFDFPGPEVGVQQVDGKGSFERRGRRAEPAGDRFVGGKNFPGLVLDSSGSDQLFGILARKARELFALIADRAGRHPEFFRQFVDRQAQDFGDRLEGAGGKARADTLTARFSGISATSKAVGIDQLSAILP